MLICSTPATQLSYILTPFASLPIRLLNIDSASLTCLNDETT